MGHDDAIDALAYACKYAYPPKSLERIGDGKYKKRRPMPKSWIIA